MLRVAGRAPGVGRLRLIYEGDHPTLLSRLEREFRRALSRHGLPLPQTNVRLAEGYVDCRWPGHRLTVELDSFRFHNSRHSWERDRERERVARARGDAVRRYTWRDVVEDPLPMLTGLATLLGAPIYDVECWARVAQRPEPSNRRANGPARRRFSSAVARTGGPAADRYTGRART